MVWTNDIPVITGWYLVRWTPADEPQRIWIHGVWFDYEHTHEWIGPTWSESETGSPEYLDPLQCKTDGTLFCISWVHH